MVFSIVGLSVTDSPSWTPPLWMIFALAGSSGMAFSIEVRPTQTPAGNVCLFWFVAQSLMSSKDDRPAMSVALSPSSFFASQRVSVMYVCFSLARSLSSSKDGRPAMSIALSLSGLFTSHCESVSAPNRRELSRLLANSLAKSIKKHSENRPKIDPRRRPGATKIDSKSLLGPSRETPWRARASRRRLRSVPEASRSVPGTSRGRPGGVPGTSRGRPGTSRAQSSSPNCLI